MKRPLLEDRVKEILGQAGVEVQTLSPEETEAIIEKWITAFDPENGIKKALKRLRSKQRLLMWDHFSHRGAPGFIVGQEAITAYKKQWAADYYVFGEGGDFGYLCTGPYADFFALTADIYVAHKNMKWTLIYTHEMHWDPGLGPYFCPREI